MKLFIGNKAYSSWSLRGWLAVKHSGLPFEEVTVPLYDEDWSNRREGDERIESNPSGAKPVVNADTRHGERKPHRERGEEQRNGEQRMNAEHGQARHGGERVNANYNGAAQASVAQDTGPAPHKAHRPETWKPT